MTFFWFFDSVGRAMRAKKTSSHAKTRSRRGTSAVSSAALRLCVRRSVAVSELAWRLRVRVLLRRGLGRRRRGGALPGQLLERGLAREPQAALLVDREELHL